MKFAPLVVPALLLLPSFPAAADTLTDLFAPDTKVVLGIRVHNLALSVAQTLMPKMRAAAAGWLKAVPLDDIDLLHDIDEVLFASSGAASSLTSSKAPNFAGLVVVAGRFDVARLSEGAETYRDVPLLECDAETGSVAALLDAGTAVIGDLASVRAAIDRRHGKVRIDPVLNDRITSLRQRYDFWGIGERPEGFALPMLDPALMESIDRFQFGMQLVSGLELTAEIHPRSEKDAEKLKAALQGIAALAKGLEGTSGLDSEGGTLKLTVSLPEAELRKAVGPKTAAGSPAAVPAPVTEAPETAGPSAAPEASPAPATPPPAATPMATAPKPPAPADKKDTVVLTLPGKK